MDDIKKIREIDSCLFLAYWTFLNFLAQDKSHQSKIHFREKIGFDCLLLLTDLQCL